MGFCCPWIGAIAIAAAVLILGEVRIANFDFPAVAKLGQEAFTTAKSRENASFGAIYPRHLRGVAFILSAIAC